MARTAEDKALDNTIVGILEDHKAKKKNGRVAAANDDTETTEEEQHEKKVALFSDAQLKKAEQDIIKALHFQALKKEEHDQAKGATRAAYNNAEKMGVPVAALKFIIEKMGKFDDNFKADVNILQERRGEQTVFNIVSPALPLVQHH